MNTLSFDKTGKPEEVLEVVEKKIPTPGDNEVLIKVFGSPINPSDTLFINGTYRYKPEFPQQTAGLEGAGIVEEVGKNAALQKGSLVAFATRGTWSEYITHVPDESTVVLPNDFPVDKAIQFYLNPFTAWGLLEESQTKAHDWLLLTAGNSTVAKLVIQLAKLRKIKVAATVRDLEQADELKALGADAVLRAEDEYFSEQINDITSGKNINAALDAVGSETGTKVLQNMAANGRMIVYGLLSKEPVQYYNSRVIFKNLEIKGFGIRGFLQKQTKVQRAEMINTLIKELAKPSFKLPVAKAFTLEQFKEALEANKQHAKKGKIIIKNHE